MRIASLRHFGLTIAALALVPAPVFAQQQGRTDAPTINLVYCGSSFHGGSCGKQEQATMSQGAASQGATITVTGRGEASGVPDLASLTLSVINQAKTAAEASQITTKTAAALVEGLKAMGIAPRDMATDSVELRPAYTREPDARNIPKVTGYVATNRITLRLRDIAQVGAVLDKSVSLGANELRGPSFSFENPDRLRDEARRAATADALRVARLYAEAMGVKLGGLRALTEEPQFGGPRPMAMMARASADAAPPATPIEPGEMDVSASITAVFDIEPPAPAAPR